MDAFIGPDQVTKLPEIITKVMERTAPDKNFIEGKCKYVPDWDTPRYRLTPPHTAYIKIAEGCNHGCAYCIIPRSGDATAAAPSRTWCVKRKPSSGPA